MDKSLKNKISNIIKIILPLGIGIYLSWYFYSSMDDNTKLVFFDAIKNVNYFWIVLSMLLGLLSHIVRAYRWKYMLEPLGHTPKFWHRYHAVMIGYLVNFLLPRAGEATRAAMLYRTDRITFSKSFGTIIAERMFDMLMVGGIFIITISLSLNDLLTIKDNITQGVSHNSSGESNEWILYLLLGIFALGIIVFGLLWFKVDKFKEKVTQFVKGVFNGVFSILKSDKPFHFIFYTVLIWVLYLVFFGICFKAFDQTQNFPIEGILVGFIAGNLGIMFTNGGIGAYPYLVGIVVMYYIGGQHESKEVIEGVGKALGMIIWLSQTVVSILLGIISVIFLPRNYKKEGHDKMGEG